MAKNILSVQKLSAKLREIKAITKTDLFLYTENAHLLASTAEAPAEFEKKVLSFASEEKEEEWQEGCFLFRVTTEMEEYTLVFDREVDNLKMIGPMAAMQVGMLIDQHTESNDKNSFIQNVLLGNLLTADLYARARRLHIETRPRVAFVIDTGKKSTEMVQELVKNLSDLRSGDFVTSVDEFGVVLVKDVSHIPEEEMDEELASIAARLLDNLHMEAMIRVRVGYGNVVRQIPEIAQSYQEAKMALEVARLFYAGMETVSYGKLGIGRLIYQLPMQLCEMFIHEVFGDEIPDILEDEEAMSTINKFFENNLNISETARQLYVHRNTLVYRLERIEKAMGLDIRKFEDAMTFRIAMMVLAHIRHTSDK